MKQVVYSNVITQPDYEPVTLEEAKAQLEYYGTLKDDYIAMIITAARKICEEYTGLSFVTQERSIKLDRFPGNRTYVNVTYGPVQEITSVVYLDENDAEVEMVDGTDYSIDTSSAVARFYPLGADGSRGYWPSDVLNRANAVVINYQTGFDDACGVPFPGQLKIAILMLVAKMFENRGDSGGRDGILDWDVQCILDTVKVTWNADVCTY